MTGTQPQIAVSSVGTPQGKNQKLSVPTATSINPTSPPPPYHTHTPTHTDTSRD